MRHNADAGGWAVEGAHGVTGAQAPKGFTAAGSGSGVDMSRQPPRLCISQWMEQNRKEKPWVCRVGAG